MEGRKRGRNKKEKKQEEEGGREGGMKERKISEWPRRCGTEIVPQVDLKGWNLLKDSCFACGEVVIDFVINERNF